MDDILAVGTKVVYVSKSNGDLEDTILEYDTNADLYRLFRLFDLSLTLNHDFPLLTEHNAEHQFKISTRKGKKRGSSS